jgi:mannose-6-phosphate isomerase-like protein (cupin superfamily)
MRGSKKDLPKTMETSDLVIHEVDWGDMHAEFGVLHKKIDVTPLLKGLPNNRDQSSHWGYVFKGRIHVKYKDHEEIIKAGDAYYIAPGHIGIFEAGTEFLEFTPTDDFKKTREVVQRNLAAQPGK